MATPVIVESATADTGAPIRELWCLVCATRNGMRILETDVHPMYPDISDYATSEEHDDAVRLACTCANCGGDV